MFWYADPSRRLGWAAPTAPASGVGGSRSGFVLLEAVIAMALLSTVVLALLSATSGQLRTASEMTGMVTAQSLAEDRLTTFRFLDYEGLRSPADSLLRGTFPAPLDGFSWEALVEEGDYDLFQVGVTVSGNGVVFPLETSIHRARPAVGGSNRTGGAP